MKMRCWLLVGLVGLVSLPVGAQQIVSVLPDSDGRDAGQEAVVFSGLQADVRYDILVDGKRYEVDDVAQEYDWTLPNSTACVRLMQDEEELDVLCYHNPESGEVVTESILVFEQLSAEVLGVLASIELEQGEDGVCMSYGGVQLDCERVGRSASEKLRTQLNVCHNYTQFVDRYIKNERRLLYDSSPLPYYHHMYDELRDDAQDGLTGYWAGEKWIDITDMSDVWVYGYETTAIQRILDSFFFR